MLRLKIADKGRSISSFKERNVEPDDLPCFSSTAIYDGVIDNSTASRIEHKKETPIARTK